ncbi:MAG: hypothetical protein BJ554DRAFT_864 [Olpidium bornovanus]|uniref:Nucleoporin Nup159/Nup146 N-terminal domain-containing protein n=1 Tax=Olpidium bornovanus TaxID=278681 RepID=A0A8H7ZTM6_9FUNG|nr:MAG: hypothetical protein BJ554DRAFT_864 [Olpidium bornovanus]
MHVRALAKMGSHKENRLTGAVPVAITGGAIRHVCLSADNRTVIVNVQGGRIHLYSAARLGQQITEAKAEYNFGKEIIGVQPNPRDDRISVLFDDGMVTVLDAQGNAQMSIHKCQASSLCWSPDGEQLVLGLASGSVEVRDSGGALVASVRKPGSLDNKDVVGTESLAYADNLIGWHR